MREQIHDQRTRAVRAEKAQLENRLKKVREKERRQKQRYEKNNHVAKRAVRCIEGDICYAMINGMTEAYKY